MLDCCDNAWKVAPCAATGTTPCYRTFCTCQDTTNYDATPVALALCTAHQVVPPGIQAIPCVETIEHVPTRIDMKGGLGRRDQVTVDVEDFEACGELLDPYFTRRPSWNRSASFMARLKALHKHYAGRVMYLDEGTIGDDGRVVESALTTRRYVIERIERSGSGGRWQITAKDVLWRLESATVPAPSVGELNANINAAVAAFDFVAGDGAAYGTAPFTVRIDDEIMTVGARSTDACTSVTRGAWGTTAATHDAGAKVQICTTWSAATVDTVWADILDEADIEAALVDTTGAATEAGVWFSGYALTACISEPTKAADLIADLVQQVGAFTWWDAEGQLVKFKGIHPLDAGDVPQSIDDTAHVVGRSVSIKDQDADRISRLDTYYAVRDWSQSLSEPSNFSRRVLAIDASAEAAREYDEVRDARRVFAYFMPTAMETEVEALAARVLDRYRDAPRIVTLDLTSDDATQDAGDLVTATVRELVDADGANKATTSWVLARARQGGDALAYRYELLVDIDQTIARWAFVNYDTCPGYDTATDADKACAFCADASTLLVGSDTPYCAI
jgi:hypothetical protein